MPILPGVIESWITVRSDKKAEDLKKAEEQDIAVELEVVDPSQLNREKLQVHIRGGLHGKWDGGNSDETSMLSVTIQTEDSDLYRLYYLTNRDNESAGIIHKTEHGGNTPDTFLKAKAEFEDHMRIK